MDKTNVVGNAGITAGGNVSIDNTGQQAIGSYISQYLINIEKPTDEALIKLIDFLEQKREEAFNKEILNNYNPSELPFYPSQLKEFVTHNRADEITKGMIYFQDHRILLISGIGGVGKTTLAQALIETRPANVPLPFWFDFNINMNATLGDVLEKLAGYLKDLGIAGFRAGKRDAGQDDVNRLTGELHRREQLWLVFDNLEIILKDDRKFRDEGMDLLFTSLRKSTHNAKIIVTSRFLPLLNNGESLIDVLDEKQELKGLKSNFAVDFLVKNGLEGVERGKLEELATGVDGHPLTLRLLIELVKKFGISDTLKDLSMFQKRKEDTIKKARRLFEKLAGDEKELLERISVFRKPETMAAIKAMFADGKTYNAVEILMDKSLLETDRKGSYWLHPLIREFSYNDLKDKKKIHYLACSYYISLKMPDEVTRKDDVQSLIEACYHACRAGRYDEAASIIFDLNLYEDLDRWGEVRTLVDLCGGLLPEDHFSDHILLSNKQIHSAVLGNLGLAYSQLSQVQKAIQYYEKALIISQGIGDIRREGTGLGNLGLAYSQLGQVQKAIELYQKSLTIAQEIGDIRGEGNHLGNLGLAYSQLGQIEKAIELYQKALTIAQEIGNRRGERNHLECLGSVYRDLGQVEKAIENYKKALAIAQETGDKRGEGTGLGNLGSVYSHLGQIEKAIENYKKALDIYKEIGDRRGEGALLGNIGTAYSQLGQIEKAIELYQKALDISKEIGNRRGEGEDLGNLGLAYSQLGQIEKAIELYQKGLTIAQEIGDRRGEGYHLGNLGLAYSQLGQIEKAIENYKKALTIAQEIGNRRGEGTWLNNLGFDLQTEKKYREALACYLLARKIRREIRDPNIKTTESNLSNLKEELGENEFEKLVKEVETRSEEIVRKMLE